MRRKCLLVWFPCTASSLAFSCSHQIRLPFPDVSFIQTYKKIRVNGFVLRFMFLLMLITFSNDCLIHRTNTELSWSKRRGTANKSPVATSPALGLAFDFKVMPLPLQTLLRRFFELSFTLSWQEYRGAQFAAFIQQTKSFLRVAELLVLCPDSRTRTSPKRLFV
eukprot:c21596_g1_i3 orf=1-489(-)